MIMIEMIIMNIDEYDNILIDEYNNWWYNE